MTFEEMDAKYPDGFTDADLVRIVVDYAARTAALHLSLRGKPADAPERNVYEAALLEVRGLYYLAIEAPDREHISSPAQGKVVVDGFPEDANGFEPFRALQPRLPAGAFCCRLFVHDWNSFIHIAGENATLTWGADRHGRV